MVSAAPSEHVAAQVAALQQALRQGSALTQRRALAKAITLVESTRPADRVVADALLHALLPHTGQSIRLGISGVPGVGKSTCIEALGLHLVAQGHRVAVLAIDPSSCVSGGAILGDKTRMERLSVHPQAFIRPSPSRGTLGGVADKTREVMLLCEAAGYDVVVVETVGVGQSEAAVHGMTDVLCLLQLPHAGDDLQAMKKGVLERADVVVVNKVDIDSHAAQRAQAQLHSSLHLRRPSTVHTHHGAHADPSHQQDPWTPPVLAMSALSGQGVDALWAAVLQFQAYQQRSGAWQPRRQQQALAWMWELIHAGLLQAFKTHPDVAAALPSTEQAVVGNTVSAGAAARHLLALAGFARDVCDPSSQTSQENRCGNTY